MECFVTISLVAKGANGRLDQVKHWQEELTMANVAHEPLNVP